MRPASPRTNLIKFDSLHDFHKGKCGYCDNKLSINNKEWNTAGFVCQRMGLDLYQSLIDKGWRRCGTYYYKADVDKCCCRPYSIRLDVLKHKIRPSHKKALKKFDKFLRNNMGDEQKPKKEVDPAKTAEKENSGGKETLKEKQPKKIEEETPEEKDFLLFLETCFKKNLFEFILSSENELKKLLNVGAEIQENFTINEDLLKNIKFLKASSKKFEKNHFLTNFLMILFAKNKSQLGLDKMKIEEFISKTQGIILSYLSDFFQKYPYKNFKIKLQIQPIGYIFFELCAEETISKLKKEDIKKMEIEEEKQHVINPEKLEKKQKKKQKKQENAANKKEKMIIEEEKTQISFQKNNENSIEMRLQKAQFEQDSFELYQKYCKEIHQKDKEDANGYKGFLCEQALEYESFKQGSEELLCGCYHMKYYLKGKLIAVGVVDILPTCLSSVYFFYDPDPKYKKLGLGIVSSLKEIEWIQKKQKFFPSFNYYYLGFYIQNCQKMVYKGEYEPSELLCPMTYRWVVLDENLRKQIEKNEANSRISPVGNEIIEEMKFQDENEISKLIDRKIRIFLQNRSIAIKDLKSPYDNLFRNIFKVLIRLWGKKVIDYLYFG